MWEEGADEINMKVCLDTSCECCECDAGEVLGWNATVASIRSEPTQMQECEVFIGVASSKNHPWRQSSARKRTTEARETKLSREL